VIDPVLSSLYQPLTIFDLILARKMDTKRF